MAGVGPSSRKWRNVSKTKKKNFRAECERDLLPCVICGGMIDWDAEPLAARSFSIEHHLPKWQYPELMADPKNWRPAHRECNEIEGRKYNMRKGGMMYRPFEGCLL